MFSTIIALKSEFVKRNAKMRMFRDYVISNKSSFNKYLELCLKKHAIYDCSYFQNVFAKFLNKHELIKKKILYFNSNLFMSKALRKAITHKSK